jgi:glycosyltransferase involved in cell wall biosynthesis
LNIWIFNHYAQGADLPGGTRHFDLARQLKSKGHNVTIFAAGFHYTLLKETVEYNDRGYKIEVKEGINFVWVKTYPYKKNDLKRMINIISFAWKLNFLIPKINLETPNLIIGSTVHPFASLIASQFSKIYKVPFVFEIRDLWPQTFIDMKLWNKNSIKSKVFKYIEKVTVKRSDRIIVLSPLTIKYLNNEYGYEKNRILLLPNGINDNFLLPINQEFKDKINITYLGGIDKVHGLEFLIHLADQLKDTNIEFNIYGDGKERTNLESMVNEKKLLNVHFKGSVPKVEVPETLSKANLLFVSTSNVLYGSENKLYEYMATGKPIVVATTGEHNDPIKNIDCGVSLDRENINKASNDLIEFINVNKNHFVNIGENGQNYVKENRRMLILGNKLDQLCKELTFNDKTNI